MRNTVLHRRLESFTVEASGHLAADAASGAELGFEVVEHRGGSASLYCYRPLTGEFIRSRRPQLGALSSHDPAVAALAEGPPTDAYLREQGETRIPNDPRVRAQVTLGAFLTAVFAGRSEFGFEPAHFEAAYAELERTLYEGDRTATVIAPLLGVALGPETTELALHDGLSLVRGDVLGDAPDDAVWGDAEEPNVLVVLAVAQDRSSRLPVATARPRFRRLLTALRLFERGGYAIGPVGWARAAAGSWRPVAIDTGGQGIPGPGPGPTLIRADQKDELRAFCDLVTRRRPGGGELAWALDRFEMGCERRAPLEALTDYLLALRALLEPEGPSSGRLAQRLAVICAPPEQRAMLAQRTARAIGLERAVITGAVSGGTRGDALADELSEHLRAILRDALCGHLDANLVGVADDLLAQAAAVT